ncbi:MAG: hypothetical protein M3Z85_07120 [Acidobacteriota bacterium]|nr:hypothetical protein [Acidobacteriota bacterium]
MGLLAAVCVIMLLLAPGSSTPVSHTPIPAMAPAYTPAIAEESTRLRDLQATRVQLEREKQAELARLSAAQAPGAQSQTNTDYQPTAQAQQPVATPADAIRDDIAKREYASTFASSVAFVYAPKPAEASAPKAETAVAPTPMITPKPKQPESAGMALNAAGGKQYRVFEGTTIEAVLQNRLAGEFAGPLLCLVTADVLSHDGLHILIPQGTRAIGEAKRVDASNQKRLAIVFHRMIMPDGYDVSLDQFKGLNQVGETGLRDQVNNHYLSTFGSSIALGILAGFSQFGSGSVYTGSGVDAYRQGVASSMSQSGQQMMATRINRLPEVTIREGHRVKIWLSADLDLPALENHQMRGDL